MRGTWRSKFFFGNFYSAMNEKGFCCIVCAGTVHHQKRIEWNSPLFCIMFGVFAGSSLSSCSISKLCVSARFSSPGGYWNQGAQSVNRADSLIQKAILEAIKSKIISS